jgi:hypothetical protein
VTRFGLSRLITGAGFGFADYAAFKSRPVAGLLVFDVLGRDGNTPIKITWKNKGEGRFYCGCGPRASRFSKNPRCKECHAGQRCKAY